jgi:hypothetical protein
MGRSSSPHLCGRPYDDHQGIPRCAPRNGQADNNHRHLLSAPVGVKNGLLRIGADL